MNPYEQLAVKTGHGPRANIPPFPPVCVKVAAVDLEGCLQQIRSLRLMTITRNGKLQLGIIPSELKEDITPYIDPEKDKDLFNSIINPSGEMDQGQLIYILAAAVKQLEIIATDQEKTIRLLNIELERVEKRIIDSEQIIDVLTGQFNRSLTVEGE